MAKYKGNDIEKVQEHLWVFDRAYAHLVCTLSENMETSPTRVVETFEKNGMPRNARFDKLDSKIYEQTIKDLEAKFKSRDRTIYIGAYVPHARSRNRACYKDLREHLQARLN